MAATKPVGPRQTLDLPLADDKIVTWTAFPEQGAWYALDDGVLVSAPMLVGGTPDMDGNNVNAVEVDFFSIDRDVALECAEAHVELLQGVIRDLLTGVLSGSLRRRAIAAIGEGR